MLDGSFLTKFFEDSEIFITGGSGIVGRALIEKLLRSCDVRRIYVLMRPKKSTSIEQRMEDLRNAKVFKVLRETRPEQLDKLVAIPGDAILPNLGITPESAKLMKHVSMIFHCAATVRFDEPLKVAFRLNVGGALETLKFAETLEGLKVFMHVSTFFSNPYLDYVEPKVYESPIDWKLALRLLEDDIEDELLDTLTRKMIIGFPNTYTFTKNIAESLVNSYRDRLPVIIYRPSIVIFAFREPEPGFPPTMMGAMGLFALLFAGIIKAVLINPKAQLDLTPQDLCVKVMCYYAYRGAEIYQKLDGAKTQRQLDTVPVFMSSSCGHVTQNFQDMVEYIQKHKIWEEVPYEKSFLYPSATLTSCRYYYQLIVLVLQVMPAYTADLLMQLFGQKPVMMPIMRRVYLSLQVMEPFTHNLWKSPGTTEYHVVNEILKDSDFYLGHDLEDASTPTGLFTHSRNMAVRVRKVLFDEDESSIPRARQMMKIKKMVSDVITLGSAYFVLRLSYNYLLKDVVSFSF